MSLLKVEVESEDKQATAATETQGAEETGDTLAPLSGTVADASEADRPATRAWADPARIGAFIAALPGATWRWLYKSKRAFAFVVAFVLIGLRIWDPVPVEIVRLRVFDLYQWAKPKVYVPQRVVIADIDEDSLVAIGQWPWPRTQLAEMVRQLFAMGAVVVGFDVVFPEPDRTSPGRLAETIPGLKPETLADLRAKPDNDTVLADMMRRTRVVLGQIGASRLREGEAEYDTKRAPIAHIGGDPRPHLLNFPQLLRSIPVIYDAAAGHGMVTLSPETDGVVRRVPAVSRVGKDIYPSLTLDMLRIATGEKALLIKSDKAGIQGVAVGKTLVPTDRRGRVWVRFTPHEPQRFVSAKDILAGTLPKESVAGKLVLVGSSAAALFDIKATPLGVPMAGVEIQAQMLESVLSLAFLVRPHYAPGAEVIATGVVCLMIIILVPLVGARWTMFLFGGAVAGMALGSWYLYSDHQMLIDVAYPIFATFIVFGFITYWSFTRSEREREEVRNAFGRYISPALVEQLADDPSRLALGGESKPITLLFCDIQGFTRISEKYDAQGLTRLINRFFTPMTEVILKWNGTVDKFMGDCVMAFWNAPLDDPDHARDACYASLDMLEKLITINEDLQQEAERTGNPYVRLGAGIGVNTGVCMVGNMGSDQRFDYSALGDPVNLASRLEGQTRYYKVPIVLGENVIEEVPDLAHLELDMIQVMGKLEPVRIYALLGNETLAKKESFLALRAEHLKMLEAYRRQDWQTALDLIDICRQLCDGVPLEGLYEVFDERIATFEVRSPGPDWDGVYVARTK